MRATPAAPTRPPSRPRDTTDAVGVRTLARPAHPVPGARRPGRAAGAEQHFGGALHARRPPLVGHRQPPQRADRAVSDAFGLLLVRHLVSLERPVLGLRAR